MGHREQIALKSQQSWEKGKRNLTDAARPRDLRACQFHVGDETFVLFSYALEDDAAPAPVERLSPALIAVAELAAAGLRNDEIAARRGTRASTVARQLAEIYQRLGLHSRSELAAHLGVVALED